MKQLGEMTPSLFPSPFLSLLFVPPFPLSRETDNTGRFRFRRYGDVEEQNKRGRRIHLGGKKERERQRRKAPSLPTPSSAFQISTMKLSWERVQYGRDLLTRCYRDVVCEGAPYVGIWFRRVERGKQMLVACQNTLIVIKGKNAH